MEFAHSYFKLWIQIYLLVDATVEISTILGQKLAPIQVPDALELSDLEESVTALDEDELDPPPPTQEGYIAVDCLEIIEFHVIRAEFAAVLKLVDRFAHQVGFLVLRVEFVDHEDDTVGEEVGAHALTYMGHGLTPDHDQWESLGQRVHHNEEHLSSHFLDDAFEVKQTHCHLELQHDFVCILWIHQLVEPESQLWLPFYVLLKVFIPVLNCSDIFSIQKLQNNCKIPKDSHQFDVVKYVSSVALEHE